MHSRLELLENGLAVKEWRAAHAPAARPSDAELEGKPERNYLAGYSLGALVALELAEHPAAI